MALDLNNFKKSTTTPTSTKKEGGLDLNAFKVQKTEQAKPDGLLKKIGKAIVGENGLGVLGRTDFFQKAAAGLTTGAEKEAANYRVAEAVFNEKEPSKYDVETSKKDTFGTHTAKTLFETSQSFFDSITNKLSDTQLFKGAGEGLNAMDRGEVEGDTLSYLAEELTGNLSEFGKSFSGRGTANIIDTMVASPLNFATRSVYGKSNPLGDFMSDFAEEMRSTFSTERSKNISEQEFSMDKVRSSDFWITTVAENVPVTLAFMSAAGMAYKGSASVTSLFGTSRFAQVAAGTVNALAGGTAMRGFESASEAEEAYKTGRAKGLSEDEAIAAGREVFVNNMKLVGLDAVQVAIALSPFKLGNSSILTKIISETAKLGVGGVSEGFEEVYQYDIQEDATGEEKGVFERLATDPAAREAGFIGATMGVVFQAGGRINQVGEDKIRERYMDQVAEQLPPNLKAQYENAKGVEEKQAVLDLIAEQDKEAVESAVKAIEEETKKSAQSTAEVFDTIRNVPSEQEIKERLASGATPTQVAIELSKKIGSVEAQALVQDIVEQGVVSRETETSTEVAKGTAVKDTQEAFSAIDDSVLERTPVDLQDEFNAVNKNFESRISETNQKIDDLKQQVKDAPKGSNKKAQLKKQLVEAQDRLKKDEDKFNDTLVTQSKSLRSFLSDYVAKNYADVPKRQQVEVVDRVLGQATSEAGLKKSFNTTVGRMIQAQVARTMEQKKAKDEARQNQPEKAKSEPKKGEPTKVEPKSEKQEKTEKDSKTTEKDEKTAKNTEKKQDKKYEKGDKVSIETASGRKNGTVTSLSSNGEQATVKVGNETYTVSTDTFGEPETKLPKSSRKAPEKKPQKEKVAEKITKPRVEEAAKTTRKGEIPENITYQSFNDNRNWEKEDLKKAGIAEEAMGFNESADVLLIDGVPVVGYSFMDEGLGGFSVAEKFRGRGIASMVLKAWAEEDGGTLDVIDANEDMLAVLKRLGDVTEPDGRGVVTLTLPKEEVPANSLNEEAGTATLDGEEFIIRSTKDVPKKGTQFALESKKDGSIVFVYKSEFEQAVENAPEVKKEQQEETEPEAEQEIEVTGEKLVQMTKTDIKKLLFGRNGLNIPDDGSALSKVGIGTPLRGFNLESVATRESLNQFREQGVFTDSFTLVNDKKIAKDLYSEVDKRYPNAKKEKSDREIPDWTTIVPKERSEASIQGYIVTNGYESSVSVVLTDGDIQQAVNADKLAYVKATFPKAKMSFTGYGKPIVFEQNGKVKALVMPYSRMPEGNKFHVVKPETLVAKKKPAKKGEKIEDTGEKIGGARKDLFAKQKDAYKRTYGENDIAALPLSKTLPNIDYKNLMENGVSEDALAIYTFFRSDLERKPTGRYNHRLRKWVRDVEALRQLGRSLFEDNTIDVLNERIVSNADLRESIRLYKDLDFVNNPAVRQFSLRYARNEADGKNFYILRSKGYDVGNTFGHVFTDTYEQMVERVKARIERAKEKREGGVDYSKNISAFRRRGEGYLIAYKKGSRFFEFEKFETRDEVMAALKTPEKIEEYIKQLEEAINFDQSSFRVQENQPIQRKYRNGDVSAQDFMDNFGFRGVEFGNWVTQSERQERLNFAYDSFKDLAKILDIPDKAISLNGELGFAFGSRGRMGAAAHYEPDKVVINLTKEKGSGTIAHEWWHALDNYMSRRSGNANYSYLTSTLKYERQEVRDAFYNLMREIKNSDLYKRSDKADKYKGKRYFTQATELGARAFEVYVLNKLKAEGLKNDFLVNLKDAGDLEAALAAVNPYATGEKEVEMVNRNMEAVFSAIEVETNPSAAMYSLKDNLYLTKEQGVIQTEILAVITDLARGNIEQKAAEAKLNLLWKKAQRTFSKDQLNVLEAFARFQMKTESTENQQVQDRAEFLEDIKKRWKIDFDVHFVDTILAGVHTNSFKQKSLNEAWGAYADNSIALVRNALENTDRHEVVHLTMANAHNIGIMRRNGISKEKLLYAQAKEMGLDYQTLTNRQRIDVEEKIAQNFERYRENRYQPQGIMRKFFVLLRKLIMQAKALLNIDYDVIRDYYDLLEDGVDTNAQVAFLENKGLLKSFISDGVLDLRGTDLAVNSTENIETKKLAVTRLKKKEGDDKYLNKVTDQYNALADTQQEVEQNMEQWRADLRKELERKGEIETVIGNTSADTKTLARYTKRKPPRSLSDRGREVLAEMVAEGRLENDKELRELMERRAEIEVSRRRLRQFRKDIADARKLGKDNKAALRDVERRMKARQRFLERKEYYVDMGVKRGYKKGEIAGRKQVREKVRDKRERDAKLDRIKTIYKRVQKATRTGKYLPLDYQKRLLDLFEGFDLTTMTDATRKKLNAAAGYFAAQQQEVPSDLADKLLRLSKTPVGKMSDADLDAFVEQVVRIYEQGVLKKKLLRSRDEKVLAQNVAKLVESTHPFGTDVKGKKKNSFVNRMRRNVDKVSASVYDPARFASYVDGAVDYKGEHFTQVVQPTRQAINEAEIQSAAILKDSFDRLQELGDTFTDDEMARIMYASAIEQGGQEQADALVRQYPDIDFLTPTTEKEQAALDIMKAAFKEVRPEIAATFEAMKNTPFPDNPDYFPYRYDNDIETYNIDENAFDFDVKKTSQGFTMERENKVDRVLNINVFETFVSSLKRQVYYAKVQPELENIKALLNSKAYQNKADVITKNYWDQFVTDVATHGRGQGNFPVLDRLRGNVSAAILGYKLSTVIIQISGAFDGMMNVKEQLGWKAAAKVFPELVTLAVNKAKLDNTLEGSIELQNRQGGQIEIAELESMYRGVFSPNWYIRSWNKYKEHAYIGIRAADIRVASAIFNTLKNGYIKEGMTNEEATAMAEQIMVLSQSSHNVANRPQVLNNSATKFLFPFSSFIFNAFNNARYDAVTREIKKNGLKKGMLAATGSLSFVGMAITYEMVMYMALTALFGYDNEEPWYKRFFASAIGRIPGAGYFIAFDGSFEGLRVNNPSIEAADKVFDNVSRMFQDGVSAKEVYNATKNALVFLGFPGTQQIHQILTAPDVAGMGSIGRELGISYDDRRNAEKRVDELKPIIESGEAIGADRVDELAADIYGKDFTEGDAQYKENKRKEVIREIAIRQKYGYDDVVINTLLDSNTNNEVKSVFARLDKPLDTLLGYDKSIILYGQKNTVFSDQLFKELTYIAKATPEDRERIAQLAEAETDQERNDVIAGDKAFAKRAFSVYKVIQKAYYESI